ncbi:nicotinate phosphoribosyltransferase [uncultured Georgenia sp.]|uniref:nicotinate phosphoribosyltransferase n=1 Tax=uncultured Georgenia sp. TaxID=378209 RepID=UPI00262F3483|nr:nicotinate phosphoribosyltransferase [uncultured Georgenia sp.]HLV05330.1 nicotinate phosphoribosyltransferase [Actinomycetaceae bacterium]
MSRATTALLTDRYELTMLEASLQSGAAHRASVFEVFARRLPGGRRYGVVAGTGRVLDAIADFTFSAAEIAWLREQRVVGEETLEYLGDYRFSGDVIGYGEGECFFPGSPILTVRGTFAEALLLETVVLSVLNHDSAVAAAASRMTTAAHGRPCLEMGARRTHEEAAVAAARAAVVGGFVGTSVLEAGRTYGIPTIGTAAHSFTLVHDDEEAAFDAQVRAMGPGTTLLVDTYDVERGVERAVAAARRHGGELGAVRLDSGDLVAQAFTVRQQLDELGATSTKITVTSDLDEYAIAALGAAPVDSYGVGTRLVTGSGHPTAELVYKLVEREGPDGTMVDVAKASASKATVGGLKVAGRVFADGVAQEELVVGCPDEETGARVLAEHGAEPLQVSLVRGGVIAEEHRGPDAVRAATERHLASRAALPYEGWRLSEGDPAIPTRHIVA